jgi:hypothetical protein
MKCSNYFVCTKCFCKLLRFLVPKTGMISLIGRGAQIQLSFWTEALLEKFYSTNWTDRPVPFSKLNFLNSSLMNELNWWNSSFERAELLKQFAQNELNKLNSSSEWTEHFKQFAQNELKSSNSSFKRTKYQLWKIPNSVSHLKTYSSEHPIT